MKGIRGFIPSSLSDWDGKVCSVIFLFGCNFRCPFCFNSALVIENKDAKDISIEEIKGRIAKEKPFIDGVCITGGEPTLNEGIKCLCRTIKDMGLMVKIDTNGSNPEILGNLIEKKLVDFIAMDIKTSQEKYSDAAGIKVSLKKLQDSIDMIRKSGIEYEFRTTAVPKFLSMDDLKSICEWLKGANKYVLQQLDVSKRLLEKGWKPKRYSKEDLIGMLEVIRPYFHKYALRNIQS